MEKYVIIGLVILVAAALLVLWGCKGEILDGPGMVNSYTRIDQETAREMMAKEDGHLVLDVRRPDEYAEGHIPGAVNLPNEEIGTERPRELPDLHQILLVYCRSGRRSKEAAQKLFDMGYTHVFEFGGIIDWTGEVTTDMTEKHTPTATLVIRVGEKRFYAVLEDNSSARALVEKLSPEPLTLTMEEYGGFEKVGDLPWTLPRNDRRITTVPGDVILYQGDKITLYYGENTWNFTRLARVGNATREELLAALGEGDAVVEFSLEWSE